MSIRPVRSVSRGPFDSHLRSGWADASVRARYLLLGAGLVAIGLLCAFYSVVAGAAHRADHAREETRVATERQVVCSAFSATSSRDLCLVTLASHVPQSAVVQASYERPQRTPRRPQLTAGL